jgi:hypothetical protein
LPITVAFGIPCSSSPMRGAAQPHIRRFSFDFNAASAARRRFADMQIIAAVSKSNYGY